MSEHYDDLDLTDNPYVAKIAASSPRTAMGLLTTECQRSERMRQWCIDILEEVAWGWHGPDCSCPLADYEDIRVRVRVTARAIKRLLDDASDGIGTWAYINAVDREQFIADLVVSDHLADSLSDVRTEFERELAQRETARRQRLSNIYTELERP